MNRNVLIVMAGGLLVAVLVAMIVQATLKGDRKKQPVKEEARVQVVVASKAIAAGETLNETNLKWADWPKSGVFDGMMQKDGNKKITDIASGKARRSIAINEPITKSALVSKKANFLAASLTPGMRAVSVSASTRRSAGGFVSPGDFVDVNLSYRARITLPGGDNESADRLLAEEVGRRASEIILQNIKVIAVDQRTVRNEEKVLPGKVFTLEVTPQQAQMLAMAESVGDLDLILRPLGDDKIVEGLGAATEARITKLYEEIVKISQERRGGGAQGVRIFNGNNVTRVGVAP